MKIKEKLKKMDVRLIEFAKELEISRPTLDSYINIFEAGEKINSEKHQLIFEKLFNDGIESKEEFYEILNKYQKLLERDKVLGTFDYPPKTTDLITSIFEQMKADVQTKEYEEDIYTFINILLRSYKKDSIFLKFARYFLYLNNIKELRDSVKGDREFLSNCYKLMRMEKEKKLTFDEEYYNNFLCRIREIEEDKEKKSKEKSKIIQEEINKKIYEKIQEQLKIGIDPEEIDISKVLDRLNMIKKQ